MSAAPIVGVDVGKTALVVACEHASPPRSFTNDVSGRSALLAWLQPQQPALIVLEASGGYEQPLLQGCWRAQLPVARLNPRQVRDFARATGRFAKTDAIDARHLAQFGRVMEVRPQAPPSPTQQRLAVLQARRQALMTLRTAERNRAQQAQDPVVQQSIARVLAVLDDERAHVEAEMDAVIAADAVLAQHASILASVPGIGAGSVRLLLAELPELGQASRQEIAALVGVAPINHDSGQQRGHRRIRGGRATLRTGLYMAVVAATVHNPVLAGFYQRLLATGKSGQVAIMATMRKLLTILNAMLRDGTPWCAPTTNST